MKNLELQPATMSQSPKRQISPYWPLALAALSVSGMAIGVYKFDRHEAAVEKMVNAKEAVVRAQLLAELNGQIKADGFSSYGSVRELVDPTDYYGDDIVESAKKDGRYTYVGNLSVGACTFADVTASVEMKAGKIIDVGNYSVAVDVAASISFQNARMLESPLKTLDC